jgi:hypothetical protein
MVQASQPSPGFAALNPTYKEELLSRKFFIIRPIFFEKSALLAKAFFHAAPDFWTLNQVLRRI